MAGWSRFFGRILLVVLVLPLSANEAGEAVLSSSLVWTSGGRRGSDGLREVTVRGCDGLTALGPLSVSGLGAGGWAEHGAGEGERPRRVSGGPPVLRGGAEEHAGGNIGVRGGTATDEASSAEGPRGGGRGRKAAQGMTRADIKAAQRELLRESMAGDARRCDRCGGPALVGLADHKGFWVFYLCFACSRKGRTEWKDGGLRNATSVEREASIDAKNGVQNVVVATRRKGRPGRDIPMEAAEEEGDDAREGGGNLSFAQMDPSTFIPIKRKCSVCNRSGVYADLNRTVPNNSPEAGPSLDNDELGRLPKESEGESDAQSPPRATALGDVLMRMHCSKHRLPREINVVSRRCQEGGCDRIGVFSMGPAQRGRPKLGEQRGSQGAGKRVCAEHKQAGDGMVRGFGQPCRTEGCIKQASFGPLEGPPVSCRTHSSKDQVDTRTTKCRKAGCTKQAFCGDPTDRVAIYCGNHRRSGDVNLRNRVCQYPEGCTKVPNFGPAGGAPKRCQKHMIALDICLRRRLCIYRNPRGEADCRRCPSFGDPADGKALFCMAHSDRGKHVNLIARRCQYPGCPVTATFGKSRDKATGGGKAWLVCSFHRDVSGVDRDIRNPLCVADGCGRRAHWGRAWAGKKATVHLHARHCIRHKEPNEVWLKAGICRFLGGCDRPATHAPPWQSLKLFCEEHSPTHFRASRPAVLRVLRRTGVATKDAEPPLPPEETHASLMRP